MPPPRRRGGQRIRPKREPPRIAPRRSPGRLMPAELFPLPLLQGSKRRVDIVEAKLKWETPDDPTKFELHYPPARAPRATLHWDRWVNAMMLDTRLNGTDRAILIALALHYNLNTGGCFPAKWRVAVEAGLGDKNKKTARTAVQRTVRKAQKLGWIERTLRAGGSHEKNQTNLYELRLPESVINRRRIGLSIAGKPGAWQVIQDMDGVMICGPFKDRANAERWIEEHGPDASGALDRVDKVGVPSGQNRGTEWTLEPPITGKYQNREVSERSVLRTASFASRADA